MIDEMAFDDTPMSACGAFLRMVIARFNRRRRKLGWTETTRHAKWLLSLKMLAEGAVGVDDDTTVTESVRIVVKTTGSH